MTNRENAEEEPTTDAPMDEVSSQPDEAAEDSQQNAPLPDWGPTDGVHGTDAEGSDAEDSGKE